MQIILQEIIPDYIEKEQISNSQVWGKKVTIKKGEHLHIVAPSGSGKTSLIHFIYGLRKDYSGTILWGERNIRSMTPEGYASLRQNTVSIIFQDLRFFENQKAIENIEIKRALQPFCTHDEVRIMAQKLGIEQKLDQQIKTCSYGEQQRIAIIRSLVQPFDFILLDEPYSHLDEENRIKAMTLIYEECEKRGAAMVFADLKMLDFLKGEKILML
jgi:putative ABC transport system ATP-binding protein